MDRNTNAMTKWLFLEMELPRETISQEKLAKDGGKEPDPSCKSLIQDFCDYTSAHGFGRINASPHWSRTVFWGLLFIAAVTIMTVQLHTLYQKYQSRPLTTLVEVETSTVRVTHSFYCSSLFYCIYAPCFSSRIEQDDNPDPRKVVLFCLTWCSRWLYLLFLKSVISG